MNRRLQILEAVMSYWEVKGWFPNVREITQMVGLKSSSTTHFHINNLIELGLLEQNDTHSQLRITEAGRAELPIPYLPTSKVSS